jgi:hypothetical protein
MENEMGEPITTKYEGKWRLIKKLRRDFAAARPSATNEEIDACMREISPLWGRLPSSFYEIS